MNGNDACQFHLYYMHCCLKNRQGPEMSRISRYRRHDSHIHVQESPKTPRQLQNNRSLCTTARSTKEYKVAIKLREKYSEGFGGGSTWITTSKMPGCKNEGKGCARQKMTFFHLLFPQCFSMMTTASPKSFCNRAAVAFPPLV